VAIKLFARQTILSTPVSESQLVVVAEFTVKVNVQDWPPNVIAKEAVPEEPGVPAILKVRLPAPLANVPAAKVAVSPVTPVDEIAVPAA